MNIEYCLQKLGLNFGGSRISFLNQSRVCRDWDRGQFVREQKQNVYLFNSNRQFQKFLYQFFHMSQIYDADLKKSEISTDKNKIYSFRSKLPILNIQKHKKAELPGELTTVSSRKKQITQNFKQFKSILSLKDTVSDKSFYDFFEIKSKIGEGAHSVVYQCIDILSHQTYAVKFLKRYDPQLIEGMRESYKIMKTLNHQYIIEVKNLFIQHKGSGCQIVMKNYPYPELRNFIDETLRRYKFIDENITADIIHKILMAVSYMHEKRVCHRDLKPENILFDSLTNQMKIIDFEISRMQRYSHEKLQLWTDTGDMRYRAPESFHGGYSFGIDVWAVGVIAFQMLVGKLPFRSMYHGQLKEKIKKYQIKFENLKISKLAQRFLSKLLCKNPDERISAYEALSDPFLLKHVTLDIFTCTSPMNSSFDHGKSPQADNFDSFDDEDLHSKFYDETVMANFLGELSEDIGVNIDE